jgi:hypothetical protein
MKYLIFIQFLLFISISHKCFSQQKTLYEKKKEEISIKYLKKIGVSSDEINRVKDSDTSGFLLSIFIGQKIQEYQLTNPNLSDLMIMMNEMKKELVEAEKLKNDVDFEKERIIKLKKEQREIQTQKEIEDRKRKEDSLRLEKEKIEKIEIENKNKIDFIKSTQLYILKTNVKRDFEKWIIRGEFENKQEYENRISLKKSILDSILFNNLLQLMNLTDYPLSNVEEYIITLSKYDIDNQNYPFVLLGVFNTYETIYTKEIKQGIRDTLFINALQAKKIKELQSYKANTDSENISLTLNPEFISSQSVNVSPNLDEWMVSPKGHFFPKTIYFPDDYKHQINRDFVLLSDLKFTSNELNLNQYFPEDDTFSIRPSWDKYIYKKLQIEDSIRMELERVSTEKRLQLEKLVLEIEREKIQQKEFNAKLKMEEELRKQQEELRENERLQKIDEERKIKITKEKQEEELKEKERLNRIEQEKQLNITREKQQEEERAKLEFELSDLGKISKSIEIRFSEWLIKNNSESERDYVKRISQNSIDVFEKIKSEEIEISKKNIYSKKILTASLRNYNVNCHCFQLKLFGDYSQEIKTNNISIEIPKSHKEYFSANFDARNPNYGYPILAYIKEYSIANNYWSPSKVFFIFPNSKNVNIDPNVWDQYQLIEKKGKYSLIREGYSNYPEIKLKSLNEQLSNNSLNDGFYFYVWESSQEKVENTITIETLGIKLPK